MIDIIHQSHIVIIINAALTRARSGVTAPVLDAVEVVKSDVAEVNALVESESDLAVSETTL